MAKMIGRSACGESAQIGWVYLAGAAQKSDGIIGFSRLWFNRSNIHQNADE